MHPMFDAEGYARAMKAAPAMVRCEPCMGRGYKPEKRKSNRGFYARTCRSCGGSGQRPAKTTNENQE